MSHSMGSDQFKNKSAKNKSVKKSPFGNTFSKTEKKSLQK